MGLRTHASLGAIVIAVLISGCGLVGAKPDRAAGGLDDPGVRVEAPDGSFSMILPKGWNDLTGAYLAEVPQSVLSGFWSTGTELDTLLTPFATVSVRPTRAGEMPRIEVEEDLVSWEEDMASPRRGESGTFTTDEGASGAWGVVSGGVDGLSTTIYSVHITDGTASLMVLIETYMGLTDSAMTLLESTKSVQFGTLPAPVPGAIRMGAPAEENGRWYSYCRVVSMAAQDGWVYKPQEGLDGTAWHCPEKTDYLGAWHVTTPEGGYLVTGQYQAERTLVQARAAYFVPEVIGDSLITTNGFTIELLATDVVALPSGMDVSWVEVSTTTPDGFVSYSRTFGFELGQGNSLEFYVFPDANETGGDFEWLVAALDSIEVGA